MAERHRGGDARPGMLRTPGRSRTDTGDPFRGPASSFGLRGLHEDTPNGSDKRPGGGLLWAEFKANNTYLIPFSVIAYTMRDHKLQVSTLRECIAGSGANVTGRPAAGPAGTQRPACPPSLGR